jgi:ferredoxin--NADP+ reductase
VALPGVPFDPHRAVIPNVAGRVIDLVSEEPVRGEYVTGWIKRGPTGIIGTNKPDAQETAEALLQDLRSGVLEAPDVPPRTVLERLLSERRADWVSYEDWQLLDALERERGGQESPRRKFASVHDMLSALAERKGVGTPSG